MKFNKKQFDRTLTIEVEGRLDTNTSPDLEKELQDLTGIERIIFDLKDLEYISSAGLRLLLAIQKKLNAEDSVIIRNANDTIRDIFEMTGFDDFLRIE